LRGIPGGKIPGELKSDRFLPCGRKGGRRDEGREELRRLKESGGEYSGVAEWLLKEYAPKEGPEGWHSGDSH
jgi:hypothetical protein